MKPFVSVIIACRNAQGTLRCCIDSLLKQDYPSFEIIVADDGSTDNSRKILAEYGNLITVLSLPQCGPSVARNRALEITKGEFVAFTDSDCIAASKLDNELLACFSQTGVVAGGGIQKSPDDETPFGRHAQRFFEVSGMISDYARQKPGLYETIHNPSCNSIYRTEVLKKLTDFFQGCGQERT